MADVVGRLAIHVAAQTSQFTAGLKSAQGQFSAFTKSISTTAKGLVAGFGLIEIVKGVINVTSEFQKFEAVLVNTLGSSSKAQAALKNIRDFALTTPFEVSEVTAAYVRWANQGLTPTIDRMKKLGDVASSLGAGFEQTAEAFKDLAVGQTKRLEEIGIAAEAIRGTDKLKLSFKGVNLEIQKNAEGVQKALDVYSQLNGVLGTSDAVSKTLGGRISNLSDAWSNLLLTIGNGTEGPLFAAVGALTNITNAVAGLSKEMALIGQAISPFHDLRDVSKETLDYLIKSGRTDLGNRLGEVLKPFSDQAPIDFLRDFEANRIKFIATLQAEGESLEDINVLWDFYAKKVLEAGQAQREMEKSDRLAAVLKARADALAAHNKALKDHKTGLEALREKQQQLIKQFDTTNLNDTKKLNSLSQQIQAIGVLIQSLEKLKKVQDSEAILAADPSAANFTGAGFLKATGGEPEIDQKLKDFENKNKKTTEVVKGQWIDLSGSISSSLSDISFALGQSLAGVGNFGDAIINAVIGFAKQLGEILIATGVAMLAAKKLISNPYTAIIAGAALLVLAGAASAAMSKSQQSFNSGGGSSSSDISRASQFQGGRPGELRIDLTGKFRVDGRDLVLTLDNNNLFKNRMG